MRTDQPAPVVIARLFDQVLLATAAMVGLALFFAAPILPINPLIMLFGVLGCGAVVEAYWSRCDSTTYRLLSIGVLASLYGAFLSVEASSETLDRLGTAGLVAFTCLVGFAFNWPQTATSGLDD